MTTDPGFIREAAIAIFTVDEAQRAGVTFAIEGSRLAISFPLDIGPVIWAPSRAPSTIHDVALMLDRERVGREASPTGGVIDSHGVGDARIALDNQPLREGDRDTDLHRVGAIECSARFLGASGRNTDAGFADRDLFWARAIEDALVVRFRRLQARFEDVDVLGERLL